MGIVDAPEYRPLVDEADPDDYRPNSELAVAIDPYAEGKGVVESLTFLFERMAPGDQIPLHTHTIDEAIVIDEGTGEVTLGEQRKSVGSGAVIFIPAGTPHGTRNIGKEILRLHAVFPSQEITIRYLERNPAPGSEGHSPQPPFSIRVRELLEGDPTTAISPLDIDA